MTSNVSSRFRITRQQVFRTLLLAVWIAALWGVKAKGEIPLIYLMPLLSLITCYVLDMFSGVICSVLTSGLVLLATEVPQDAQLAVLGVLWASVLLIFVLRQNTEPDFTAPTAVGTNQTPITIETRTAHLEASSRLNHDLRTPINLIDGYCEAMLNPINTIHEPLPTRYRADLEAIQRNVQSLKTLLDQVLTPPQAYTRNRNTGSRPSEQTTDIVILLADQPEVVDLFKEYMPVFNIISAASADEIIRQKIVLTTQGEIAAIVVTVDHLQAQVARLKLVFGKNIPVISCAFPSLKQTLAKYPDVSHLMKPISHPALSNAIHAVTRPITTIVLIDDNLELVRLFADMLGAILPAATIWKAYSGGEGLALIDEQQPDLVIVDLRLPDMDGLTVIDTIRTTRQFTMPIMLISGVAEDAVTALTSPAALQIEDASGTSATAFIGYIQAVVQAITTSNA